MSKEYLAVFIMILATVLPQLGVEVSSEALTTTVSTIVVVVSGIYAMYRRYKKGDISPLGVRK